MICWFFLGVLLAIITDMGRKRKKRKAIRSCTFYQSPVIEIDPVEFSEDEREEPEEIEEDPSSILARSDIDRYEATKIVYTDLLDALEEEKRIIQFELNSPNTTEKRRATLARRKSTLLGKIATTTSKLYTLDRLIEKAYQSI